MRWILFGIVVGLVIAVVMLGGSFGGDGAAVPDVEPSASTPGAISASPPPPGPNVVASPAAVETEPFVAPRPDAFVLRVRVVSVTRRGDVPVEVATLTLDGEVVGTTDRKGLAVVHVPGRLRSGTLAASINLRPIAEAALEFPRDDGAEIVLARRRTSGLEGRVVDTEGRPIASARCVLFEALYPPGRPEPVADASEEGALTTGEDGTFRFDEVGGGAKRLVVSKTEPGRALSTTVVLDTIADATTRDLEFDEERDLGEVVLGGTGLLRVLVRQGDRPAAGVLMRLATYGDIARDVVVATDAEGRVEFAPLPDRDLRLEPAESWRAFAPVRLFARAGPSYSKIAGDRAAFEAQLHEDAGEELVVFSSGAIVEVVREILAKVPRDAILALDGDAAGEVGFQFFREDRGDFLVAAAGRAPLPLERKVEAGRYRVVVGDGTTWFEASATVTADRRTTVRVLLEPGVRVRGRVTKDGKQAKGFAVRALPDGTEFGERVRIEEGAFELVFPRGLHGAVAVRIDDRVRLLVVPASNGDLEVEAAY